MKKMMVCLVILCLVSFAHTARGESSVKIGYIDIERAFQSSNKGKEVMGKLLRLRDEKQLAINKKQEEIKSFQQMLQKQAMMMKDEVRLEKQAEYQSKIQDLERFKKDAEGEMKREQIKLFMPIQKEMTKIIKQIGEEGGFTFIFEKSILDKNPFILFAKEGVDLTDELVRSYNAISSKKSQ